MVAREFLTDPQTVKAPGINDIQNRQLILFLDDIKFLLEKLSMGKAGVRFFEEDFNSQLVFISYLLQLYKEIKERDLKMLCAVLIQSLNNPQEGLQFSYKSLIALIKEIESNAGMIVTEKKEKTRIYTILAMQAALLKVIVDICNIGIENKVEPPGIRKTLQVCIERLADWYNVELVLFSKVQAMKGRYLYKPSNITTRKLEIFRDYQGKSL